MWLSVRYARSFAIVQTQMGPKLVSIVRNSGVSAVEGFFKSMEIWSRHSEMSVISQVSTFEGCSLSGVPLYM